LIALICAATSMVSSAALAENVKLALEHHVFTPAEVTVVAGERFQIEVENRDATPAEFESYDMHLEKIIVGGGKITLRAPALKPGRYKFFDDFNPDLAKGTIIAVEKPAQ
jgi:hypothetical protein